MAPGFNLRGLACWKGEGVVKCEKCETVIHLSVRRVRLAWTHIFEGCNCCIVRLRGCNSPVSGNIARLFVVKARLLEAYVTFIAGVTLLDHLLWKHRSLESSWQNQNHPTNRCNFVNPNRKKCMWNSFERGQQQLSQSGHMSYFSARTFWRVRSLNHAHASFSSSRCFRSQVRSYGCEIILKSCSRIFQLFQIF